MRSACSLSAGRSAALAPLLQICVASRPCVQLLRAFCSFPRVLRGDDRDYHRLFGFHRRASSPSCVHIAYYKCGNFPFISPRTAVTSDLLKSPPTTRPVTRHHHYKFSPPVWSSRSLTTQPLRVIVVPLFQNYPTSNYLRR